MCLTVSRRSRDLRPLSRDLSVTFFKKISNCLKRTKNVVWQSADGRVTSDHCRVTVQWLFSKKFQIAWNVQKTLFDNRPTVARPPTTVTWPFSDFFQKNFKLLDTYKKRCLTVGRRSRDLRPLSRDHSVTFFKKFSNCLKRSKNVVWQSADGCVTSDYCRVTVQWLFSKYFQIAWNIQETLFDGRVTVAWPPTTVAWPLSNGSTYASVCCLSRSLCSSGKGSIIETNFDWTKSEQKYSKSVTQAISSNVRVRYFEIWLGTGSDKRCAGSDKSRSFFILFILFIYIRPRRSISTTNIHTCIILYRQIQINPFKIQVVSQLTSYMVL